MPLISVSLTQTTRLERTETGDLPVGAYLQRRLTQTTRLERTETRRRRSGGPLPQSLTQTTRLERTETAWYAHAAGPHFCLTQTTRLERTETVPRIVCQLDVVVSPKRLDLRELKPDTPTRQHGQRRVSHPNDST